MQVRAYKKSEYERVKSWWDAAKEFPPTPEMLPEDTTFFVHHNGVDLVCFALYKTNCPLVLWVEACVGNPESKGPLRKDALKYVISFSKKFGKLNGYKQLFCMAHKKELEHYYQAILGFTKTVDVACMTQRI